jgi:hypothetical protein
MAVDEAPIEARDSALADARPDMIWISGGTFRTGSDQHYLEEAEVTIPANHKSVYREG